jgi:hypothetical protein
MSGDNEFCMQVKRSKAVLHRGEATNCKVIKAWLDHAEKSKGYMGYIQPVEWKDVTDKEGAYRRCPACFPSTPPRDKAALDVSEYRQYLTERLDFYYRYHTHTLGDQSTWGNTPAEKLTKEFARTARAVGTEIADRYDAKHARTMSDYWLMLAVTRELFQEFLGRHASLDPKAYELLRTQMQKGLMKYHHVQLLLKEGGLDRLWLENSLPTQKQLKDHEACSKLNAEISRGLAGLGMIPCNGNKHPFFCFCGFGGTRLSAGE